VTEPFAARIEQLESEQDAIEFWAGAERLPTWIEALERSAVAAKMTA
jgi:hypothetical protein